MLTELQGLVSFGAATRGFWPVLGNVPSVFGRKPRSKAPVYVTWSLTERCNLSCKHCSFGPATPELTEVERVELAHKLANSKSWGVSLSGGEPTLVSALADYVAILHEGGLYTSVATSGFRLGRHVPNLLKAGLDNLTISIDHYLAGEHDAFRGRSGLFEEASEAINQLCSHRKKRPRVQIRTTIHRENVEAIPETIRYWQKRADNVVVQVIQDNGIHKVRDSAVLFQSEDRPRLEKLVETLQSEHPSLRTAYFNHMVDYVFEPEVLRKELDFRCMVVPGTSVLLTPNGDVRLCYGHEESTIGNIMRDEMETLWTSTATCKTRRHMKSRDLKCMCWEGTNSPNLQLVSLLRRF